MFILGIDGGGTSTRLEIRSSDNALLRREKLSAFNISAIGEAEFRHRMREICALCGDMAQCESVCIGGAGASRKGLEDIIREELSAAGFHGALRLLGDHEIALKGAIGGAGCILIAGTGSVCFGMNENGNTARCGGWGHIIDDSGSGYALGREALSAAVRYFDGRCPEGEELQNAVLAQIGEKDIHGLLDFVYFRGTDKSGIAAVAPALLKTAESGDPYSGKLLTAQAKELFRMVEAVKRAINMPFPELALLGGLFERDSIYRRIVSAELAGSVNIILPRHDALWGAAQLAYEIHR